jgi:Tfp pilus tip-associated adhesin PilY1
MADIMDPGSLAERSAAVGDLDTQYAAISTQGHSPPATRAGPSASHAFHRSESHTSTKERADPYLDINLPYRTLSAAANLDEYRTEAPAGQIPDPTEPDGESRYKLVTFVPGDPENPKNWSKAYRWYCTMVVAVTCFVVAFASSVITADIEDVAEEFNVSIEVALVSISVFVVGFGVGK